MDRAGVLGRPFLLEDQTRVWFFPKCVWRNVNRMCLCIVTGETEAGLSPQLSSLFLGKLSARPASREKADQTLQLL